MPANTACMHSSVHGVCCTDIIITLALLVPIFEPVQRSEVLSDVVMVWLAVDPATSDFGRLLHEARA